MFVNALSTEIWVKNSGKSKPAARTEKLRPRRRKLVRQVDTCCGKYFVPQTHVLGQLRGYVKDL